MDKMVIDFGNSNAYLWKYENEGFRLLVISYKNGIIKCKLNVGWHWQLALGSHR
jgi:hypothetical protein